MNARGDRGGAAYPARWRLRTPAGVPGAIAILEVSAPAGEALDEALAAAGVTRAGQALPLHAAPLRSLAGVDRGLAVRVSDRACLLMPHGGVAIVRELIEALTRAGIAPGGGDDDDPIAAYPEARSHVEARALHALAHAPSPLAIDLLLAQHELWKRDAPNDPARDTILGRLLRPPLVVAVGPPNIGKSTLLNALARREVAIVADEPGTTRDHVGATLNLAGLVVHYVDTPGLRSAASEGSSEPTFEDSPEAEAIRASLDLAANADLVLLCRDGASDARGAACPALPAGVASRPSLRVALRTDLAGSNSPTGPWLAHTADQSDDQPSEVRVSAHTGEGLSDLVAIVRERLVPRALIAVPTPWKFWES